MWIWRRKIETNLSEQNALYNFIANNQELELLESILNDFNPLKILKIEDYEIRHSNILSWLLNPNENHGLGDEFFKKIICDILLQNEEIDTKLDLYDIYSKNYDDIVVHREYPLKVGKIDILIEISNKTPKIVIFFENKIKSKESKNQLLKYYNEISQRFTSHEILPVYLTLKGEIPSLPDIYNRYSYINVLEIIKFLIKLRKTKLNAEIIDFLNQYISILEILTMSNKKIEDLCQNIYLKHKDAIELINQYAASNFYLEEAISEFKKQHEDIEQEYISNSAFWFTTGIIREYVPMETTNWKSKYPIAYWFKFDQKGDKIGFILEVGPFEKPDVRIKFIECLRKKNVKLLSAPERALRPESKYTRIHTNYDSFKNWDNQESIVEKMNRMYDIRFQKVHEELEIIIKDYFQKDK